MVKILAIIPTLRDIPLRSLLTLLAQTLQPRKIIIVAGSKNIQRYLTNFISQRILIRTEVVYVRPDMREHLGVRVGKAINTVLEKEDLHSYDYILKMDSDVILHPRCLEKCVKKGADLIGLGPFMLVRIEPFIKVLAGRWPETPADDSYIRLAFIARGLKVEFMPPEVLEVRRAGKFGNWRYYFYRGIDDYRTGINPLSMCRIILKLIKGRRTLLPIFTLIGYFLALIMKKQRCDFAGVIFREGILGKVLIFLRCY